MIPLRLNASMLGAFIVEEALSVAKCRAQAPESVIRSSLLPGSTESR